MVVLPIASGKGGVGKSLVAVNIGLALGEAGKKVVLVDLDLGASNLHMFMGIRSIKTGIGHFLNNKDMNFEDIILDTEFEGVRFIPGDAEIPGIANLKGTQKRNLIKHLLSLDADYLIIDLGAGTSNNVLDFFLISGRGIVVTTPTLTAVLNAYLFLKNAVFRIMSSCFKSDSPAAQLIEKLKKEGSPLQKVYIPKLLEKIKNIDEESHSLFMNRIETFHPCLVLNLLSDQKDAEKATQVRRSVSQYLNLDLEHLGIIYKDALQNIALNSRIPIVKYKPGSVISQAIYRIADKLLDFTSESKGPLDLQSLEESYQIAELEAEADYQSRIYYLEELLHCGGELSKGELIEIIKSQQYEVDKLKKESNLLKAKLVKAINQGFIS
ncbi:MAG: P-loop NTPase [Spirochaetales bacterium]|nr:P-loop NTPase [Spirochaetales bacterium]